MDMSFITDLAIEPGKVFDTVVVMALVATAGVLVLHLLLSLVARRRSTARRAFARWTLWEKLLYLATLLVVIDLAVTSFYAVLTHHTLAGWLLLAHMVGAGAFVAFLPLITLTWGAASRFGQSHAAENGADSFSERFSWLCKVMFWLFLVGGVVTAGSALCMMLPFFGTEGLHHVTDIHRYGGLLAVVTLIAHFYGVWLSKLRLA